MPQVQAPITVRDSAGVQIGTGVATGNNAAWRCQCDRKEWLIGRTGDLNGQWDVKVHCPSCSAEYFVYPQNHDQDSVDYVKKL